MTGILSKPFRYPDAYTLLKRSFFEILHDFTLGKALKWSGISLAALVFAYICKIGYSYRFFKSRGIQGPKPSFFFGNFPELKEKTHSNTLREWTQKYGKVYGYFDGHLPILVTTDLEVIQEIFIRQYSNFSARKKGHIAVSDDSPIVTLFDSTRTRWKKMRTIMNPTFSAAKLRELGPLILKCVNRLIEVVGTKHEQEIDVTMFFKHFTMDTIWNCAFGIDINLQTDLTPESGMYFNMCERVFQESETMSIPMYFGLYFHEFKNIETIFLLAIQGAFSLFYGENNIRPFVWLMNKVSNIVATRQKEIEKKKDFIRKDYLQLLLDAHTNEKIDYNGNQIEFTQVNLIKKLTTNEIKLNLVLFMLAGYETTSTCLSYCTYVLATHPDEQIRLYEEIESNFPGELVSDQDINYDKLQNMEYLDMFIKEVLRMYPIGNSVVTRRCTNPTVIKGIKIPTDLVVAVDVLSLHYDPEIWGPEDPNVFYPQRFADTKRNQLAFMGFGQGPRNCIGMKFALQELKYALIKLLKKYEVHPSPNTPKKMEFTEGVVRTPKDGVKVVFKNR